MRNIAQETKELMAALPPIPKKLAEEFKGLIKLFGHTTMYEHKILKRMYRFVDKFYAKVINDAAVCSRGCDHGCYLNVDITEAEARLIATETGLKAQHKPVKKCFSTKQAFDSLSYPAFWFGMNILLQFPWKKLHRSIDRAAHSLMRIRLPTFSEADKHGASGRFWHKATSRWFTAFCSQQVAYDTQETYSLALARLTHIVSDSL